VGSTGAKQDPMTEFRKYGNYTSFSIKGGDFH
jgi:hypothetical protein